MKNAPGTWTGESSACPGLAYSPVDVQSETVSLPTHGRRVGFQQEAAQELNERLLVGEFVQLVHQSGAELIFLAARGTVSWEENSRGLSDGTEPTFGRTAGHVTSASPKEASQPHLLAPSPCLPFCSSWWRICSARMAGLSWTLRGLKDPKTRMKPTQRGLCCHRGRRRAAGGGPERHLRRPGS